MLFSRPIIEIIKERTSWRTYLNKALDPDIQNNLERLLELNDIKGPFNNLASKPRFLLISIPEFDPNENIKIGTYGMIKGAQQFIVGATKKSEYSYENYGYIFETIILSATDMNLGTCWLGGTFNRSQIAKLIKLKDYEVVPAISPIGYPGTRRWKERVIRSFAKAKIRKPWNELFFDGNFDNPLSQKTLGDYETILEMVRMGPSAGNKQPWRILKDKESNIFHFFIKYSEDKKLSMYNQFVHLDIGIAVCHFDLSVKELGITGRWEVNQPKLEIPKDLKYIISWIKK